MSTFVETFALTLHTDAKTILPRNSREQEPVEGDFVRSNQFYEIRDRMREEVAFRIKQAPRISDIKGDTAKERNRARDKIIEQVLLEDVLTNLPDDERDEVRSVLMLIIEAVQGDFSPEAYGRFNDALRKRFLRWVIRNDESFSGPVHVKDVRKYLVEGVGLSKVGPDQIVKALQYFMVEE